MRQKKQGEVRGPYSIEWQTKKRRTSQWKQTQTNKRWGVIIVEKNKNKNNENYNKAPFFLKDSVRSHFLSFFASLLPVRLFAVQRYIASNSGCFILFASVCSVPAASTRSPCVTPLPPSMHHKKNNEWGGPRNTWQAERKDGLWNRSKARN